MAYLPGWSEENRVKVTVDNTEIDSPQTHFPVPIVLGTSVGQSNQDTSRIFDALVYPYRPTSVDDDFTGTDDDPPNSDLWSIINNDQRDPYILSNALRMYLTNSSFGTQRTESRFTLSGDFDIQIDWNHIVQSSTADNIGRMWMLNEDHSDLLFIGRRYSATNANHYVVNQKISGSYGSEVRSTTSDTSGKLRVTRVGTTLTYYVWTGSAWSVIDTRSFVADDLKIWMDAQTSGTLQNFTIDFDNFIVTSGTINWNLLEDTFTGDDNDPPNSDLWELVDTTVASYYVINNNKLRGAIVSETVDIKTKSIFKISGDFDIQFDFDKVSSVETSNWLSGCRMLTGDEDGILYLDRRYNGSHMYLCDIWNITDGTTSNTTATSDTSGKLRIVRSSNTLTGYYWDGSSWVQITTHTSAHYADDIYFEFRTKTVGNISITFDFDNFIINPGTIIWPENLNPNRKKIAITKDDGITEIFGEIENWDSINEKAVIWVSKHDLELDDAATTNLYLYYDAAHADNDNYIGDTAEENTATNITGDDFTGTDGDLPNKDLWGYTDETTLTGLNDQEINNNTLKYTGTGTGAASIVANFTKFKLSGDFDIQIDFGITTPGQPTSSSNRLASLYADTAPGAAVGPYCGILRYASSTSDRYAYTGSTSSFTGSMTGDLSGKLRLTRVGSVLKGYMWSGTQWEWDGNTAGHTFLETFTDDIYITMYYKKQDGIDVDCYCDNFIINSGTVKYKPSQRVWDDNFKFVAHMAQDPSGGVDCILDSTVNANHGTPSGTMLTEDLVNGEIGKAIDFDGVDDAVVAADDQDWDDISIAGTIESTYNIDVLPALSKYGYIAARRDNTALIWAFIIHDSSQSNILSFSAPGGTLTELTGPTPVVGTTYNAAVVWDASSSILCQGGVQVDSDAGGIVGVGTVPLSIGNRAVSLDRAFDGKIAEVRVSVVKRSIDWLKVNQYALTDDLLTFDFEDEATSLTDMALDIKAYQDSAQDIKSDLILAAYSVEDAKMSLAAYLQHISDLKTDLSLYGLILQNMVLDAQVAGEIKENIKTDLAMYFQGINDTKLDLKTFQSIVEDLPLDLKIAVEVREDGKLDLSTAYVLLEDLKTAMLLSQSVIDSDTPLDFSIGDGIIFKDNRMDLDIGDGNKKEDVGLSLVLVSPTPVFRAVYALHLESAVKEII